MNLSEFLSVIIYKSYIIKMKIINKSVSFFQQVIYINLTSNIYYF